MSTNDIFIGQGKLYLDPFKKVNGVPQIGQTTGELFVGECPEFNIEPSSEQKTYMSNTAKIKTPKVKTTTSVDYASSFTTNDLNADNMCMSFLGTKATVATAAATVTAESITTSAVAGARYQLGVSVSNPTGVRNLDQFTPGSVDVLVKTITPAATLTAGLDYTVDMALGAVTILNTAAAVGKSITVDYKTKVASRTQVISGNTPFVGALRYVADNPIGDNKDLYLPYVQITPNGSVSFIGEDWASAQYTVNINQRDGYSSIYVDGRAV